MVAVSVNRTHTHYHYRHMWSLHNKKMNKLQIDECSFLNPIISGKVIQYNNILLETNLYNLPE